MELRWSLKELYPSFESEEFIKDMKILDKSIAEIKDMTDTDLCSYNNTKEKIEKYVSYENKLRDLILKLISFCELSMSVDCKDETAIRYEEQIENKLAELAEPEVRFIKWLINAENIDEVINESELLKEHSFHLKELMDKGKYMLGEKEETIIAKLRTTGSSAWAKLQQVVTSTLDVEIELDGKVKHTTLPVARNMAYENDAIIRKAAYEGELKAYEKICESSAAALNGIKGEVITVSKMRGYKSVLDETLIKSRLDRESLEAMLAAMKEYFPVFRKYFRKKSSLLRNKDSLPFYDLFAPLGHTDKKYTYDEARKFVVDNFRTFSDRLADFADNAFENKWIDAEPRTGKIGGAFCCNIHVIGESRILSNFSGNFGDLATLAHELGHGYHNYCLKSQSAVNCECTMPIAETASTFCETIVKNAALRTASKDEALAILESDISDNAQIIIDIYSRYLFESEVMKRRERSSLSVDELKEIMLWAQKETYGDGLDPEYLHPYMWICKDHYYSAEVNFYNFPYAFGLLFAKGLYSEYLKRGKEFVKDYDKLLSETGKNKIADVTMMMGINIHDDGFWKSSLDIIEDSINKFLKL